MGKWRAEEICLPARPKHRQADRIPLLQAAFCSVRYKNFAQSAPCIVSCVKMNQLQENSQTPPATKCCCSDILIHLNLQGSSAALLTPVKPYFKRKVFFRLQNEFQFASTKQEKSASERDSPQIRGTYKIITAYRSGNFEFLWNSIPSITLPQAESFTVIPAVILP